jgi:hypothetical protein
VSSRTKCARNILIFSIISVSIQSFILSFKDETFIMWGDCDVLKIKKSKKRQQNPWRLRSRYK